MKERPILFSGAMVRSILNGSKSQTRRVVKPQPAPDQQPRTVIGSSGFVYVMDNAPLLPYPEVRRVRWDCPYGQPGDRLWVRETWQGPLLQEFEIDADPYWHYASHLHQYQNPEHCEYAADGGPKPEYTDADDVMRQGWRPSIHMPRWASRITLEVTGVRVERLQDISEADAQAEGWTRRPEVSTDPQVHKEAARDWFMDLWESINGPGSWGVNPWVWVVEFRSVEVAAR